MNKLLDYAGADGLNIATTNKTIKVRILGGIVTVEILQGETEDDAFQRFMNSLNILACVEDSTHQQ